MSKTKKFKSSNRKNFKKSTKNVPDKERLEESLDMSSKSTPRQKHLERSMADNDWSWYASTPQLVKDYASLPFGSAVGLKIPNSYYTGIVPGVMMFGFYPTIGVANKETDPVNVAMRKLYSFVRYANSGAKNYDAPDMMMYIIACDSAYMYLEWMKRIYGSMFSYTAFNRYYPRGVIKAMWADFDDLEANLADFRGFINQYALKLNQLWIPANLSYTLRHKWMCQHIYVDSQESPKAQTYLYNPMGFYKFTVSGTPAVSSLTLTTFPSVMKLSNIIQMGNGLLEPLITNEDIGIMSGDILKAYGIGGIAHAEGISEDFRVLPEYSPEVMSQFENLMITSNPQNSSFNVTQNTAIGGGFLISNPVCYAGPSSFGGDTFVTVPTQYQQNIADALFAPLKGTRVLNFHHSNVTPEEIMVATRGMFTIGDAEYSFSNGTPQARAPFTSLGSEAIVACYVVSIYANGQSGLIQKQTADWQKVKLSDADHVSTAMRGQGWSTISQFDWHPDMQKLFLFQEADSTDITWTTGGLPFLDLDFYTFVEESNIQNMNATALLSEFTVPMIG